MVFRQSFISRSISFRGQFVLFIDLMWNKNSCFPKGKIFISSDRIEWASALFRDKFYVLFKNVTLSIFLGDKVR